jgi:arylsulfatase A-like enzyme/Flp pilus assembly protein TadD
VFAFSAASCSRADRRPAAATNVLLVTIDTLRADRIGTGVAPTLDRLAANGVRFTSARTAAPLTLPSHATIHTGLLPPEHGVRENGAGALAANQTTVATRLKAAGYLTAAFVGAFVLDRRFGLAQGFDVYDDQIPRDPRATERLEAERPAGAVIDRALAWLNQQSPVSNHQSHWFIWIHLYDPHAPYAPPPDYRGRTGTPYDDEVAYADAQLARLVDAMRASGALDRTLVVVAGDHGEGLGDHGEQTHGMLLYESTVRVPLIVSEPGRPAAVVDQAVSLAEVASTILGTVGVAGPPAIRGRNLLQDVARRVDGGESQADLYSETEYPHVAGWSTLQALTDGRWKTIVAGAVTELYDLSRDPGEQHDLNRTQGQVASAMRSRADAIHARGAAASASRTTISADAQERLRALGYVASSAAAPGPATSPNPAGSIAAWNDFEEALAALNARQPRAVDSLKTLATAHPDAVVFQSTYARALKDAGRPLAALNAYREAARRWPTDATLVHDLAATARDAAAAAAGPLAVALRDEAMRADRAALVLDPTNAMALNGLGLLQVDAGRPVEAAASFERAAALDPTNASYWSNLGNARRAGGDRAGAADAYHRALAVDLGAADAANGLGVLEVEAGRAASAVTWFERALAAAPDFVEARLNLGIALQQSGQAARAAEAYRRVLAAPPTHVRERKAAAKLLDALRTARPGMEPE